MFSLEKKLLNVPIYLTDYRGCSADDTKYSHPENSLLQWLLYSIGWWKAKQSLPYGEWKLGNVFSCCLKLLSELNAAYSYIESCLDSCYSINIEILRISKVNHHSTWLKIRQHDKQNYLRWLLCNFYLWMHSALLQLSLVRRKYMSWLQMQISCRMFFNLFKLLRKIFPLKKTNISLGKNSFIKCCCVLMMV